MEKALSFCKKQGIHLDAVNENLPEITKAFGTDCRKIFANEYWDDRAVPMSEKDIGEFSDGFHTFNSLYHQRLILFAALVNTFPTLAWKSHKHSDGEAPFGGGWFIVGIDTTFSYDNAILALPDGSVISGKIESWKDYDDGDQIQVKIDGTTYLVHSVNIVLIKE